MSYEHIMRAIYGTPWAITEEKLNEILAFMEFKANGGLISDEELAGWRAHAEAVAARSVAKSTGAVSVLPIFGMISHRGNMVGNFSGGTSTEKFSAAFRDALADPAVKAIVFDVDSPGGTVDGVPELADEIASARGQKPIVAVANTMMASAAYWLGSQADELVAAPSAQVGSIGVLMAHTDASQAAEKAGIKTTFIKAGKYKAEGNPTEPLSGEAAAYMQSMVDEMYAQFVKGVARGRKVSQTAVREGFGQGRTVLAQQAVKMGMVDRIATLDRVLADMGIGRMKKMPMKKMPMQDMNDMSGEVENAGLLAAAEETKTKHVDGEDLPKSAFAYQGSNDPADWKLPIEFSSDAKSKSHTQNAIARWSSTDMPNAEEKARARGRIKAAAKKHDIEVADGSLAEAEESVVLATSGAAQEYEMWRRRFDILGA